MVTLKDVAERANVAVSTASYALNNDQRIPQATKQRVLQAAQELGYTPKNSRGGTGHNFQRQLVADGLRLKAYPFTKILDVDHVGDIVKAENFLAGKEK